MSKRLLIGAILIGVAFAACNANFELPNIESGSASFAVNTRSVSITTANFQHTFTRTLPETPKVAFALQSFSINSPAVSQWSIHASDVSSSKMVVAFRHEPIYWTSVRAGFLASARPDVILGATTAEFGSLKSGSAPVFVNFPTQIPNFNTSIARVFITGYELASGAEIFIRGFDKKIGARTLELGVQVAGNMEIKSARVNFIVFSPSTAVFASYGGGITESAFSQTKVYNVQKFVHESPLAFVGVANLRQSAPGPVAFSSSISKDFYVRLSSSRPIQEVFFSYIILGVPPASSCSNCKEQLIYGSSCVAAPPSNAYLVTYRDGGRGYRECPSQYNWVVNSAGNGCACRSGFAEQNGICVAGSAQQSAQQPQSQPQSQQPQSQPQPQNMPDGVTAAIINRESLTVRSSAVAVPTFQPTSSSGSATVYGVNVNTNRNTNTNSGPTSAGGISQTITPSVLPNFAPSAPTIPNNGIQITVGGQQSYLPTGMETPTITTTPVISAPVVNPPRTIPVNTSPSSSSSSSSQQAQSYVPTVPSQSSQPSQPLQSSQSSQSSQNYYGSNVPANPAQSFTTNAPNVVPAPNQSFSASGYGQYTQGDCSTMANTYWTGYRCACRVGYLFQNSLCIAANLSSGKDIFRPAEFIYKISLLYKQRPSNSCTKMNEVFNGQFCDCASGFVRDQSGNCIPQNPSNNCPVNSVFLYGKCVCNNGFDMVGNNCIPSRPVNCGDNENLNAMGECVCRNGYVKRNGRCVPSSNCPPYSSADANGVCQCDAGYRKYDGVFCSLCPPGQVSIGGRCITTCGVNEVVNPTTGRCQCISGYGIYGGVCNVCPRDFFLMDGYCATCPVFAQYDSQSRTCVCRSGMTLRNGVCQQRCTQQNEVFKPEINQCVCYEGLVRIGGVCQIPQNCVLDPVTLTCIPNCNRQNQVSVGGVCVCQPGFGRNSVRDCINCATLPGFFLRDGYCITCPANLQPNANAQCACPPGQRFDGSRCANICREDQLMDNNGNCYSCPINEEKVNQRCQCKTGFQRVNEACQIVCPPQKVLINNLCGICVLGTRYDARLGACVCPEGYYMNSNRICEVVLTNQCGRGFYFSGTACVACSPGCVECTASVCTQCSDGFYPAGTACLSRCGDGILNGNEQCDDGNANNYDGCSANCQREPGFDCIGVRPTICTPQRMPICGDGIINGNEQCDDRNTFRGDGCSNCQIEPGWTCNSYGCRPINPIPNPIPNPGPSPCSAPSCRPPNPNPSPIPNPNPIPIPNPTPIPSESGLVMIGDIRFNYNNVFIVLQTPKPYPNLSDYEKKNFIKYTFPDRTTEPTSVYCIQNSNLKDRFECLLVYASGIPNKMYTVNFNYNYQGDVGNLAVNVNPLLSTFKTRSLK